MTPVPVRDLYKKQPSNPASFQLLILEPITYNAPAAVVDHRILH